MIGAGVIGATGYTGAGLVRILLRHPSARLRFAASGTYAGEHLSAAYPGAPDIPLIDPGDAPLQEVQVVFLCLPHTASAQFALRALDAGVRVIDLSADFRLRDPAVYQRWYGSEHPAPHLLQTAVYGLTELHRDLLPEARLVANPGCYPTSVLLGLKPLLDAGILQGPVIIDAKSGVSGAGRKPSLATHFVEVAGNVKPYNVGRSHRHLPEMEQAIASWGDAPPRIIFSPHLVPASRGLLSTIYAPLPQGWDEGRLRRHYIDTYAGEPFVSVLPRGEPATFSHVNCTNKCAIGLALADNTLILTSAIDNLLKGASGQAVQNMNAMFRIEEAAGLL